MNFNRSEDRDEDLEINFIPLIDVLLVIIIFLVVSTTFSKIHELEIKLPVAQANPLDKKDGTGPYTGTFQAPADGVYLISGFFLIDTYRCHLRPITFNVSVIKNENERIKSFHLPIVRYVPLPNDSYPRDYTHNRKFDLLLQLKVNDAIRLKIQTKQCVENLPVYFSKVIFSGYKIY